MARLDFKAGGMSDHLLVVEHPSFSILLSRLSLDRYMVATMITVCVFCSAVEAIEFAESYCYRLRELRSH